MTGKHRSVIADFLLKAHKPLKRSTTYVAPLHKVEEPRPDYKVSPTNPIGNAPTISLALESNAANQPKVPPAKCCKHCQSTRLEARSGQYGYYFFCRDCSKNTKIVFACAACGGEGKIRKQGNNFFADCKACSESNLLHSNSAT